MDRIRRLNRVRDEHSAWLERNTHGFSLLETVVVACVVALAISLLGYGLIGFLNRASFEESRGSGEDELSLLLEEIKKNFRLRSGAPPFVPVNLATLASPCQSLQINVGGIAVQYLTQCVAAPPGLDLQGTLPHPQLVCSTGDVAVVVVMENGTEVRRYSKGQRSVSTAACFRIQPPDDDIAVEIGGVVSLGKTLKTLTTSTLLLSSDRTPGIEFMPSGP